MWFLLGDNPTDQNNLCKSYARLISLAGVRPIRFHDLRHTAASIMLSRRIPIFTVSRRLSHNKASTTLDRYGHLMPNDDYEAAVLMDEIVPREG